MKKWNNWIDPNQLYNEYMYLYVMYCNTGKLNLFKCNILYSLCCMIFFPVIKCYCPSYICTRLSIICILVCWNVCMYVCMYVCLYISCMYVWDLKGWCSSILTNVEVAWVWGNEICWMKEQWRYTRGDWKVLSLT